MGVVELARGLVGLGWEVLSTGGTARALREAGVAVQDVSEVTGHPEMMEGRVKTLHPAIHAGLLARRERADDMAALEARGYAPIDLVAVNLYPFQRTVAAGAGLEEAVEQIDIGGPTMLRSAAKNFASVYVVVDPGDYGRVLDALRAGGDQAALRLDLARKVFQHTAQYDAAIAEFLARQEEGGAGTELFPPHVRLELDRVQPLRYGENPDQAAAFYAERGAPTDSLPAMRQLHGKELSFNNLLDIDAATSAVSAWADEPRAACVIIKHNTPCGIALGDDAEEAYRRALRTDPASAFGGIVALNRTVDPQVAAALAEHFLEVIVAPGFDDDALELLRAKKNIRLIQLPVAVAGADEWDMKRVRGGMLIQQRLRMAFPDDTWRVVTKRAPTDAEWRDLRFAWRVAAAVKSNAIVLARDEQTLGIGAGQMSRVDSSRIAVLKAGDQKLDLAGAVLASDAYFPFRDGVDAAAVAGAVAVVQPGGSVRDEEVITAANEHGIAMVFTGRRVFRH
jgi:phosphoribosylaminoimidazolecarboxamide formyltransferase/IMP cyclohydrolase